MFIVHGAWLRRHMRWILAGLLIVLIPGFIALFTTTGGGGNAGQKVPTVRGKPVSPAEFQATRNSVLVQYLLSTGRQVPRDRQFEQALTRDAMVQLLALRQAREFGIRISDVEVRQQTERQPLFHNEQGQFDYYRYTALLGRFHLKPHDYEETVRQQVSLARLRELVCSGAKVTPLALQQEYRAWSETVTIQYVQLAAVDERAAITITDEDAKAHYEKNAESYRTPRQVKVRYAHVAIDTNAVAVTDPEIAAYYDRNKARFTNSLEIATAEIRSELTRSRALRRAGDRASELSVKVDVDADQPRPDFAKVAAEHGAVVAETEFFGPQDTPTNITAGIEFNQAAFSLTAETPFSDPVEGEDGYYVLELLETKPSAVPPFEQVKARVVEQLTGQRAHEAAVKRGGELRQKAVDLVAAGKSFTDACAELKLTPLKAEPFAISAAVTNLPAATAIKQTVLSMRVNDVSEFLPTAEGGVFFHLAERQAPAVELAIAEQERFRQRLLQQQQETLWESWLASLWRQEQVDLGFPPEPPPAPEPVSEDS